MDDYAGAYFFAQEAAKYISEDSTLINLLENLSMEATITSDPGDALIQVKSYLDPIGPWHYLGRTPLADVSIPVGPIRIRVEREGYLPIEILEVPDWAEDGFSGYAFNRLPEFHFTLEPEGSDSSMVRIPGSPITSYVYLDNQKVFASPDYFMAKYEVTNVEYQEFISTGGYSNSEYWEGLEFTNEDGSEITWTEATDRFVDETGFKAPSTWQNGIYPEGTAQHPVAGISWFEAAAYARFKGKELPTVHHWGGAVDNRVGITEGWEAFVNRIFQGAFMGFTLHNCLIFSRIDDEGTVPVGSTQSLGPNGLYDQLGNVREWCWNRTDEGNRVLLGKSYADQKYGIRWPDAVSPWIRSMVNGLRLAYYPEADPVLLEKMKAPVIVSRGLTEVTIPEPISEDAYQTVVAFYNAYRRTDPDPDVIDTITTPSWERRQVEISTFYGSRMSVYIFIPKNVSPPYQTVIYHPGQSGSGTRNSAEHLNIGVCGWLPEWGRALVFPIWYSMYERGEEFRIAAEQGAGLAERWRRMYWDIVATLDYLETKPDEFNLDQIGYMGYSAGGIRGPLFLALDSRLKAGVILGGGQDWWETDNPADQLHIFVPYVTQPALMINGTYDYRFPVETKQKPMYEMLGTPEDEKFHMEIEANHGVMEKRYEVIRLVTEFLNQFLGQPGG